jgi:hypothetical protein
MSETSEKKAALHRRVLARLGIGTAVVAAAVLGSRPAAAMVAPGTKGGTHYKESDHVKQYYKVNRY